MRAPVLAVLFASCVFSATNHASAFERQWHLGGGLGATAYPSTYSLGPAVGLNGAYGISDVFDVKLELLGSLHSYELTPLTTDHIRPLSIAAGLSYKLDVLQWIPYGALLVGYSHIGGTLAPRESLHADDAIAAVVVGLDYAVSRDFGLGLSVRGDLRLSTPGSGEAITPLLRAEYHWGF